MSADIPISIITFLVFVAIGAIWDLNNEITENAKILKKVVGGVMPSWIEEIKRVQLKVYENREIINLISIIRANPTTRHHLQTRNSKGRFE